MKYRIIFPPKHCPGSRGDWTLQRNKIKLVKCIAPKPTLTATSLVFLSRPPDVSSQGSPSQPPALPDAGTGTQRTHCGASRYATHVPSRPCQIHWGGPHLPELREDLRLLSEHAPPQAEVWRHLPPLVLGVRAAVLQEGLLQHALGHQARRLGRWRQGQSTWRTLVRSGPHSPIPPRTVKSYCQRREYPSQISRKSHCSGKLVHTWKKGN